MIVVADSGSTKTDWRIVDLENDETVGSIKTIGFNPYFHDTNFIYDVLEKELYSNLKSNIINAVEEVFYYGAGCSSPDKNEIVERALKKIFPNANIHVEHDLLGASRATLGDEEGIACILGTGANSCVWTGSEVLHNIPSHGYIYGDEGSGSYLGKELLKMYLNDEMAPNVKAKFEEEFDIDENEILERTYKKSNPNVFLASFARFYSNFPESKKLINILRFGFNDFFQRRVIKYPDYFMYKLGFVGSIAYHFQEDLKVIAKMHGLQIVSISKCPIDSLVEYHLKKSLVTS